MDLEARLRAFAAGLTATLVLGGRPRAWYQSAGSV